MRILLLSHKFYPDIGGIEINSEILSFSFSKMNHEVHLVTWSEDLKDRQFPFIIIRKPSPFELIKQHLWADVILENNPCLRLAWPNALLNKKSIVVLNTWIFNDNGRIGLKERLKLIWLKKANAVIAVSNILGESTYEKAIIIGNPYRAEEFNITNRNFRPDNFVFLGRLVSDKGADLAIRAIFQIKSSILKSNFSTTNPTLTIIGDGPDLDNLRKLVYSLDMNNCVYFKGSLSGNELANELNRYKYMIVPSIWKEPFGNVALEGIACGCIPIVADGGGLPDAVGNAGLVFQRGNLESLIESMERLLNDLSLQEELKKNGPNHLKRHEPDIVSEKYLQVISKVAFDDI